MANFAAKFKAFIASVLVAITFISPYYPQKMDVKVDPIEAAVQEVVFTFENNTNRNVVCVTDEFKVETKIDNAWVTLDDAHISAAFDKLDSAMTGSITVDFSSPLAIGQYVVSFRFKTTNGWLTKGRTFTTEYAFTVAE